MSALAVQNGILLSRKHVAPAVGVAAISFNQKARYSDKNAFADDVTALRSASIQGMKRGTGGRCSFSGIVATVFGSSGFLGSYVVNRLGKIGSQVILPYRGDFYEMMEKRVCGDLGQILFSFYNLKDEDSIRKTMKYSNVVINLIGRDWQTKNFSYEEVNVNGPRRLARIAREEGVERFIHISDLNASPKPPAIFVSGGSQFLKTKYYGELAVREEFPDATILKPSFMFGNADRFLRYFIGIMRHQGHWLPMYKKGEHTIKQPVFGGDVAAAIINACRDKDACGKTYLAVGPKRYRLSDLVDWFHDLVNRDSDNWDYKRYDIKYDPTFKLKALINEHCSLTWPIGYVHVDYLERESISDLYKPDALTLEDLGVQLTPMEDMVPWLLKHERTQRYYDAELNEFFKTTPPKPVKGI